MKKFIYGCVMAVTMAGGLQAQDATPTLIVTNKPIAEVAPRAPMLTQPAEQPQRVAALTPAPFMQNNSDLYSSPRRTSDISADRVLNDRYFDTVNTLTSQKIRQIEDDMYKLQGQVADAAEELRTIETVGQELAANYYAAIATINTQLQSGTTPGNPRLKNRLILAEDALDTLAGNITDLNKMAVQISDLASVSGFLQQQARSSYSLSGAVEEDHVALSQLEDELTNTSVAVERLLNNVNDNITRAAAYMAAERQNIRTLGLAIAQGDLFGKSLSNRPFSMISSEADLAAATNLTGSSRAGVRQVGGRPQALRPLMKIRFDRPDVDFSQALYMSVSDALQQYPNSTFKLVAVAPGTGNPAKLAIESNLARRNAKKVLRNMVQMGVDTNRVTLANLTEEALQYNEVHLYIR